MGRLIRTGYTVPEHDVQFVDDAEGQVMVCECGWQSRIHAYQNQGSIREVQRKFNAHLVEVGVQPEE